RSAGSSVEAAALRTTRASIHADSRAQATASLLASSDDDAFSPSALFSSDNVWRRLARACSSLRSPHSSPVRTPRATSSPSRSARYPTKARAFFAAMVTGWPSTVTLIGPRSRIRTPTAPAADCNCRTCAVLTLATTLGSRPLPILPPLTQGRQGHAQRHSTGRGNALEGTGPQREPEARSIASPEAGSRSDHRG